MNKKIAKSENWVESYRNKLALREATEVLKMCHCCYAFKYDGDWHFEEPSYIHRRDSEEEISVQFTKCPACIEELLSQFDGKYV